MSPTLSNYYQIETAVQSHYYWYWHAVLQSKWKKQALNNDLSTDNALNVVAKYVALEYTVQETGNILNLIPP